MNKVKHTPSEWIPRKVDGNEWVIDAPKGDPTLEHQSWDSMIVVYGCEDSDLGPQVAEANAKLVGAAPHLIKALLAVTMVTKNGQICFRTNNDVPMGMSKHKERLVRRALYKAGVI